MEIFWTLGKRQAYSGPRDSTSYQKFELSLSELDKLPELIVSGSFGSGKTGTGTILNLNVVNWKKKEIIVNSNGQVIYLQFLHFIEIR